MDGKSNAEETPKYERKEKDMYRNWISFNGKPTELVSYGFGKKANF